MITCPWCGTSYLTFQSNCKNCGGPLQAMEGEIPPSDSTENLPTPPPAPRSISKLYVWRLLITDGWSIAALVFGLVGAVFTLVGAGLTLGGRDTDFVGLPFLLLGVAFLIASGGVFRWRYRQAVKVVDVLRNGEATRGQIVEISENYSVMINGSHPWIIRYEFQANGQSQAGKVSTLTPPGQPLQVGKAVCVLYLPAAPQWSSIYPHP